MSYPKLSARLMGGLLISMVAMPARADATANDVTFTRPPAVSKVDGGAKIDFAASAATDIAVYVEDADGKVVRHLAAGVIGPASKNPPAPLRASSLEQSLVWDGKDDAGKPVDPTGKKVRVALGLKPTFDRFLLFNPDATPDVDSLAVAPGGNLYIFYRDPTANGNQGGIKVQLVDRQLRHVRQIVPFSADLPYDKVKATGAFQDAAGHIVPQTHNWHTLNFYPDPILARGRSMSPFSCPVADGEGRLYWLIDDGRLCCVGADGSVPYPTFLSEPLLPQVKDMCGGRPALALSSDGKSLYAAGLASGMWGKNTPLPVVLKIDLATRKAEVFLGKQEETGKEKDLFTAPRGLAVHGGLLYVCDPDADRVAVFDEQKRTLVGEIKVQAPHVVQVHPKSGAVYVCTYDPASPEEAKRPGPRNKNANILKYADYKAAKELYRLALPRTGLSPNGGTHRIALDASADPPLIWSPGLPYGGKASRIACYRDTGTALEPIEIKPPAEPWGNGPRDLLFDRARDELYVKVQGEQWHQFDAKTDKIVRTIRFPKEQGGPYMGSSGAQLGVDPVGNYVTHCWGKQAGLMRWSRDLKPLNWDGQATHRADWGGMMTFQLNYMAIRNDEIYVIKPVTGPHHLEVYDMGLNLKRRAVWNVRRGSCVRVDAAGNIYVTAPIRPADRDLLEFFDGKLGKIPDYYNNIGAGDYWYVYMHGSIAKFPPAGGAFCWPENDRDKNDLTGLPEAVAAKPKATFSFFQNGHYPHKPAEVQGADWVRFGYTPYSETYGAGTPVCMCEGTGFAVDGFGRVFYPNVCRFRVDIVDAANNNLPAVGRYGNQDAKADAGYVPLAWPTYVAVSDRCLYVNDTVNMRVVKVKLDYATEQTVPVP